MKHGRSDYNVIQDLTVAAQLAALVLYGGPDVNKSAAGRQLASEVLGLNTRSRKSDPELLPKDAPTKLIPWDEPVFLVRGQDVLGGETVRAWIKLAEAMGVSPEVLRIVNQHAIRMDDWEIKKVPDVDEDKLLREAPKHWGR